MKIGIDARLYFQTGVGVYINNLLYYLDQVQQENDTFFIYLLKRDFRKINFKNKNLVKIEADYLWHSLSEQVDFLNLLYHNNLDLMHFTYFSYPIFYKKRFVITLHDLTPLLFKTGRTSTKNKLLYQFKYLVFKTVLKSAVSRSSAIITPSETVKRQIVNYYGNEYGKKTFPVYEGVNNQLFRAKENQELKKKFSKPFFIYVGNFYPHKNVEKLIKSFSKIKEEVQLILLGPNDYFQSKIVQLINQLYMENKIVFYCNPTYAELTFFYKNSLALIHPSMSEGFGLPLIEAAYFNCPIIASDIPIFQELLGDTYLSFNPLSEDDMVDKINYFLQCPLKFDYKAILKKYSFKKMTEKTLEIYSACLNN